MERGFWEMNATKITLGIFAFLCLIDFILTKMELGAGVGYETNILSGVQFGIWFFGVLKIFEFIIIAGVIYMFDNVGKERVPVPLGMIIGVGACMAQLIGMNGTLTTAAAVI